MAEISFEHDCECNGKCDCYGEAISFCTSRENGELWVGNGEYASQVNYCPICGYKAKKQIGE